MGHLLVAAGVAKSGVLTLFRGRRARARRRIVIVIPTASFGQLNGHQALLEPAGGEAFPGDPVTDQRQIQ